MVFTLITIGASAQKTIFVCPAEIDDVLTNPGIGFMTFHKVQWRWTDPKYRKSGVRK